MALQPQLGTVPERRPRPDSDDRRHSDAVEGILTRGALLDAGAAPLAGCGDVGVARNMVGSLKPVNHAYVAATDRRESTSTPL
jgi:hypothetical protein